MKELKRIQERAAYCLQFEVKDPRASFVTVTKVELSKDLKHGKIFWSHYGPLGERRRAAGMLEHAAGFIQRQIARVLETRTVPHLRWVYDESLEHADEIDRLIREARKRDAEIRGGAAEGVVEELDEVDDDSVNDAEE